VSKRTKIAGSLVIFILLSLIALLMTYIYNREAIDLENAIYMEKSKLKDDMLLFESMLENDHSIVHSEKGDYINEKEKVFSNSYHHDLIGHLSHDMGIDVAIYIKENNSFHCIASTIVDSDGNPAVNIFLGEESEAYSFIQSGVDYTDKDVIQGDDYLTLYRPLFQPETDEVIGILFTGVKMSVIKNINLRKSDLRATYMRLIKIGLIVMGALLAVTIIVILRRITSDKDIAEESLRTIFDTMPLGANIHSKNMDFFDCNESVVKLFEMPNKKELIEIFPQLSPTHQPDGKLSSEKMQEVITKAYVDGYNRFEWMHQKLDGEPIPCEVTLVRTRHGDDFIITAYLRDLRESKRMLKKSISMRN